MEGCTTITGYHGSKATCTNKQTNKQATKQANTSSDNQVVLEETGVERYVHLRSVDDEYEHLESTLPNRARNGGGGGAAGGVGGSPPAEGVESGPGANENGGDVDTVVEGGDSDGRSSAGAEAGQGRNHRGMRDGRGGVNGGSEQNSGTPSESSGQEKPERPGGDGDQCQASSASPSAPPEEQRIEPPCRGDDDAGLSDAFPRDPADTSFARSYLDTENDAAPGDTDDRGLPSPSPPPSAYHYRSPSCSPRLSPRPMRSPYRQEGVGGRESSGRGESARQSGKPCERRGEAERPACSPAGDGGDAVRRGRHAGRSAHVAGAGGQAGAAVGENNDAKTDEGEERGHERQEEWGSSARVLRSCPGALPSPLPGPAPAQGDGDDRGAGSRGSGGDGLRPDAWPDAEPFRQSTATKVDRTEGGAFTGGGGGGGLDGGGIEGARLASSGEFADEYEGSVILIDNRSHAGGGGGEGGPDDSSARLEEEWWQPESGSALRGVDFAFDKGDSAAKSLGKEVSGRQAAFVEFVPDDKSRGSAWKPTKALNELPTQGWFQQFATTSCTWPWYSFATGEHCPPPLELTAYPVFTAPFLTTHGDQSNRWVLSPAAPNRPQSLSNRRRPRQGQAVTT